MQVVILAAGKGKRMGNLTQNIPKPMLEVNGRPVLEYKFDSLPEEIDEVIFVVNYLYEVIKNYFGNEFCGKKIKYAFQKNLSGSGGSLHAAKNLLRGKFLVLMGDDIYCKKDLEKLIKNDWAVLAKEVEDPSKFGVLKVNERGFLQEIIEKPKNPENNLVNTGAYVLQKDFFDFNLISISETEFGLPQTLAAKSGEYKIKVEKASFWQPINNLEELEKAEELLN